MNNLNAVSEITLTAIQNIPEINPGDDPNFTIISHSDQGFSTTNRKVSVFGIDIYAVPEVNDSKLLHAANVLAQYLDNNEDEIVDNIEVHNKMLENKKKLPSKEQLANIDGIAFRKY